jgi:hypothetical protein
MSDNTYRVLDQYRENSDYADEIGKRYHFPEKHHKLLDVPGTPFLYYEPERKGNAQFFGCGELGKITSDPKHRDMFFVDILNYRAFPKLVNSFDSRGRRRESEPYYNSQNAVRRIAPDVFQAICTEGGVIFSQSIATPASNVTQTGVALSSEQLQLLWVRFHRAIKGFTDFQNPGNDFVQNETKYKRAILARFQQELGAAKLSALVRQGQGTKAIEELGRLLVAPPSNFVSFYGWKTALGGDDNKAACDILSQYVETASSPYQGPQNTKGLFDIYSRHKVKPKWDVVGVLLWALRPVDFFPVKISYYRGLAKELGCELPPGLPDADKLHTLIEFGRAFWKPLEPQKPADWVDVQSFIWCVCPTSYQLDPEDAFDSAVQSICETSAQLASPQYWTFSPGSQAEHWDEFYRDGIMAIGWDELEDLRQYQSKDDIRRKYLEIWPSDSDPKNDVHACWQFPREIQVGDIIFVNQGRTKLLGYGQVEGDYQFDTSRPYYKNTRKVKWLAKQEVDMPEGTILHGKTLTDVTDDPDFVSRLAAAVGLNLVAATASTSVPVAAPEKNPSYSLDQFSEDTGVQRETLERWVRAVERKGQAVFYGPPGTGKTFLAEKLARHLVGGGNGLLELVQFHPAYAYEDFMQGLRPKRVVGGLDYPLEPGRFLDFCKKARTREGVSVLIIDEINRANLARVFGELMYLLEYRLTATEGIPLAGGGRFRIPTNVRLIGTMNTADRSIALVDHALRRRFAFFALAPDYDVLRRYHKARETGFPVENLIKQLTLLNAAINDLHYSLGISFFMRPNLAAELQDIWTMEVEPYLEEYFFDQRDKFQQFRWDKVSPNINL